MADKQPEKKPEPKHAKPGPAAEKNGSTGNGRHAAPQGTGRPVKKR
jgi:hypothetical protein